jgi:integrase
LSFSKVQISIQTEKKKASSFTVSLRGRPNNSTISLYLRLTYKGEKVDKFTEIKCSPLEFKNGKIKGNNEIITLLKSYENNLHKSFMKLREKGQIIDLQRIASTIFGNSVFEETPKLFDAIDKYIKAIYLDAGNDFSEITKVKNQRYGNHLKQFAKDFFNREGIDLTEIKPIHDNEIIKFMKHHRQAGHNHATMHVQWFKRFYDFAIGNDWILKNPFLNFKPKHEKVEIKYLTKEDINKFEELKLSKNSTYERVRDFFLFSCYTGLSYMDLKNVSFQHIKTDNNGVKYLEIPRLKTTVLSIIPLLEKPLQLIEKYRFVENQDKLFCVPTNQCMNRTLKELAEIADLSIFPTFHISRKTCATWLIDEGVPVAIVQRVLGHSNISTTLNHYGKINEKPIIDSFSQFFNK